MCVYIGVWVYLQVHNAKVNALTGGLKGRPRWAPGVGRFWERKGECVHSSVSVSFLFLTVRK